ncbi:hypothetical protein N0V82_003109 [Gnomoniopsis sp. IMI 355080]|nr:hypothetical protein N0V82_003109 [Gnomoniopsis sp. IMI 355080]
MFGLAAMDEISRPCSEAMAMERSPDFPLDRATDNCFKDATAGLCPRRQSVLQLSKFPSSDSLRYLVASSPAISLPDLPSELIDHILAYLSPLDLASASLVNQTIRAHAVADHLWQNIVQSNVPGQKLTTPAPCPSFRELYIAHDPHWFLTKYKIWFSDKDLTGKLVIARYDQSRGVIEGYQLLANSSKTSSTSNNSPSLMDTDVEIHEFEPEIKLHLDKPILQIRADSLENTIRATTKKDSIPAPVTSPSTKGLSRIAQRWVNFGATSTTSATPAPAPTTAPSNSTRFQRFAAETPMPLDGRFSHSMFSTFMLAKALPPSAAAERGALAFPYGNIWPPPAIPATERVSAAHFLNGSGVFRDEHPLTLDERPSRRTEISDKTFRIRSWLERPSTSNAFSSGQPLSDWPFDVGSGLFGQSTRHWLPSYNPSPSMESSPFATHIGDSVTTYSTLDPDVYTPTADQPWKGIWVGDYSGHGCEFLLIKQNHTEPFDEAAFDATREEQETDADFARRKADAKKYRGSLEAVKLTGDPNIPRGECTFVAEDLGDDGYVTTVEEQPFAGARVVQSKGHVARTGFTHDRYIKSQLLLISENRLAQFWVGFNHISFFERVDIDKFLAPN